MGATFHTTNTKDGLCQLYISHSFAAVQNEFQFVLFPFFLIIQMLLNVYLFILIFFFILINVTVEKNKFPTLKRMFFVSFNTRKLEGRILFRIFIGKPSSL